MPEVKANFKSTTATSLEVTGTATVAALKVQNAVDDSKYEDIKYDPSKNFETITEADKAFIPTMKQVIDFITKQNKANLQIYDFIDVENVNGNVVRSNMTVAGTDPGSGIYFKPQLSTSSQTGYFTTDDINTYNLNRLTPQSDSGASNLKPYYLSSVTIGTNKSLTVYNQGTVNLAYNATSTSWAITVSADGKTVTFS